MSGAFVTAISNSVHHTRKDNKLHPNPMNGQAMTAEQIVKKLNLEPHPEGGYFRRSFCDEREDVNGRPAGTAIYYLLRAGDVSHCHKIDASEVWHFYDGSPLEIVELDETGPIVTRLGPDILAGDRMQKVLLPDRWFGARLVEPGAWALVGCTVAPGFLMEKFVLGERTELLQMFPKCREVIEAMTPGA